ncbi:heme exporter protein CcmB [Escherichia coli]
MVLFIILTLFPIALGQDSKQLAHIAPGAIWIAALLSPCWRKTGCSAMTTRTAASSS